MALSDLGSPLRRGIAYVDEFKVHAGIIAVQFVYGSLTTLTKYVEDTGMSFFLFIVYRHAIATLAITPFAFLFERRKTPPLTFSVLWQLFLLAFLGITASENLYFAGLWYISPTCASALNNLVPPMTFVMAVLLRLEKVDARKPGSLAKILGTVICLGGATVTALYKGPAVGSFDGNHVDWHNLALDKANKSAGDWIKGCILVIACCATVAAWYNMQAVFMKSYAAPLSMNAFICFFGTIQSGVLTLMVKKDRLNWAVKWDLPRLLNVLYAGIVCSGMIHSLQAWCIQKRGPLFAAIYKPLATVAASILSIVFLREILHWGSVAGAVLMVAGLYVVIWGKTKENANDEGHSKIAPITSTEAPRGDITEQLLGTRDD